MTEHDDYEDFLGYCQGLSDAQLENVLGLEHLASRTDSGRMDHYHAAVAEARRRGWTVQRGKRVL